jgi:hypothetical protein
MISLLQRRHQSGVSGSGPEDNNLDFHWSNRMPRLHPANESYQRLIDKDDCKSSSVF